MSREVDERVVEMQFDNRQFESGVAQTMKSLDGLTNALKFEGISKSVSALQNGISKVDFSPISNGVGALESTLTTLGGRIKVEVFDRIAKYAVDTGEKIFGALTTKGARAGFAEYETQQGAVQTILANTQHLGTTITDVNKALGDLNEYADLTIYNFTEMTRNIGTFTAAGLDLETSTSAIKGIANLAAVSGSTSEQASRAMYQLSQALASGTVKLQDWNSVVNAGMGGKVFQTALIRTAKHMGIAVDETQNFRESISSKEGTEWLTSEVLSETLKQFSGDMDEAALAAQGWSSAEIKEITDMAKTATDAATVVKTFSQLMDTLSEQIGSGWTQTWQTIFGDFEESKALWTSVYKAIGPYIDAISDLRNAHLKFWKENEGREKVLQAFANIWSGVSNLIDNFTASFRKAFPIVDNFGQVLTDISDRFLKFSERFKVVKDKTDQVTEAFENVSDAIGLITAEDKKNALDIWNWGNINGNPGRIDGQARVEALGESYDRVQKYINTFIDTGYDVAKTDELLGVGAEKANQAISKSGEVAATAATQEEKRDIVLTNLVKTLRNLADIAKVIGGSVLKTIKAAGSAFADVFDPLMASGDLEKTTGVMAKIAKAFEITAEKAEDVKRIFRGVFAAFDIVYQLVRAVAGVIAKALVPSLGAVDSAGGGLLKVLGNFGDWIFALDQAIKDGDLFTVAIEKMGDFMGNFTTKIRDGVKAFGEWSGIDFGAITSKVSSAITKGLDKFKEWTGIDIAGIFSSIWDHIKTFIGYLKVGDFSGAFNYVKDGFKNFFTSLVEYIQNFDFKEMLGKVGEIFGGIGEWIGELFDKAFGGSKKTAEKATGDAKESLSLLDILSAILYGGYTLISKAITFLYDVFTSDKAKEIGSTIGEFFSNLFGLGKNGGASGGEELEDTADSMNEAGEGMNSFYEQVKPFIGAGFIGALLKIFSDLSTASKNFSKAPLVIAETLEQLSKSFDQMTKAFKIETMSRFVKTLANSILKLVVAIAAIMILNQMEGGVAGAVAVVTFMIAELLGALKFAQDKLDTEIKMTFLTKALKGLATTMLLMSAALFIISKVGDVSKMAASVAAMTLIMGEIGGMMYLMSEITKSKQFRRGAEGLLMLMTVMKQLGKTMIIMSIALKILSSVKNMGQALLLMIEIFAALGLMLAEVAALAKNVGQGKSDEIAALGGVFMMIAGAVAIIAPAIALLSLIPSKNMTQALTALAAIGAIFMLMTYVTESAAKGGDSYKSMLSAAAGMVAVAFAIDLIVPALAALSVLNPDGLLLGVAALGLTLGVMVVALAGLASISGSVLTVATGILAVAVAVAILTPALIAFAAAAYPIIKAVVEKVNKSSSKTIGEIAKKILMLSGAAAVAGVALVLLGAGLAVVGAGLSVIGVATLLLTPFTLALGNLFKNLNKAADNWKNIKKMLTEMGPAFAEAVTGFIKSITTKAGEIGKAITKAAPAIGEAVVTVFKVIIDTFLGLKLEFIKSLLQFIDAVLAALIEYGPNILEQLEKVIELVLDWLNTNVGYWVASLVVFVIDIILGIINGVSARLDEIVDALMEYFISLINALANAIETKGDRLLAAIGNLVLQLFILLGKAFRGLGEFLWGLGGQIIEDIGEGLAECFPNLWEDIKTFFTEDLPKKFETLWEDFKQLGEDIINGIIEGIKSGWEAAGDFMEGYFGEFWDNWAVGFGVSSPSKKSREIGQYVDEGLVKGLEDGSDDATSAATDVCDGVMGAFDNGLSDLDGMGDTDFDLNAKLNIDTTQLDELNTDDIFANAKFDTSSLGSSLDFSSLLAGSTADSEAKRAEADAARNASLDGLSAKLGALTDKLGDNVITVPDNATFNIPVNIDGNAVANATAPYLDIITANNISLENMGVTAK